MTSTHLHTWGDRFGIVLILELATIALQLAALAIVAAAITWALLVALPAVTAWLTGRAGSPDRSAS